MDKGQGDADGAACHSIGFEKKVERHLLLYLVWPPLCAGCFRKGLYTFQGASAPSLCVADALNAPRTRGGAAEGGFYE